MRSWRNEVPVSDAGKQRLQLRSEALRSKYEANISKHAFVWNVHKIPEKILTAFLLNADLAYATDLAWQTE